MNKLIIILYVSCIMYHCDFSSAIKVDPQVEDAVSESEISSMFNPEYLNILKTWNILTDEDKNIFFSDKSYIGYIFHDLSLYNYLNNSTNTEVFLSMFRYISSEYTLQDGRFISPGYIVDADTNKWHRVQFARDNLLLYTTYEYSQYIEVLSFVEEQVSLWILLTERRLRDGYFQFPVSVNVSTNINNYSLVPNHSLEYALLLSQLYFESKSIFFQDSLIKDIIDNEIGAALSLIEVNGAWALAETRPNVYDTNYAGYASSLLYYLCHLWNENAYRTSLKSVGKWLFEYWPMDHPWNIKSDWPNYLKDRFYSYNLIGRIPAFYASNVLLESNLEWIDNIYNEFPDSRKNIVIRWYNYRTIPLEYLSKETIYRGLRPLPPKIIQEDGIIKIIGRDIKSVVVDDSVVYNGDHLNNLGSAEIIAYANNDNVQTVYKLDSTEISRDYVIKVIDNNNSIF